MIFSIWADAKHQHWGKHFSQNSRTKCFGPERAGTQWIPHYSHETGQMTKARNSDYGTAICTVQICNTGINFEPGSPFWYAATHVCLDQTTLARYQNIRFSTKAYQIFHRFLTPCRFLRHQHPYPTQVFVPCTHSIRAPFHPPMVTTRGTPRAGRTRPGLKPILHTSPPSWPGTSPPSSSTHQGGAAPAAGLQHD